MRVILFAIVSGVLSGLLFDVDFAYIPGALFALAIIAGSSARFDSIGALRSLSLVGASVLANYLAVRAAAYAHDLNGPMRPLAGAVAGVVGALVLGLALRATLRVRALPLLVFVGGLAGAPFLVLPHAVVSYVLWQGAVAAVIARSWQR